MRIISRLRTRERDRAPAAAQPTTSQFASASHDVPTTSTPFTFTFTNQEDVRHASTTPSSPAIQRKINPRVNTLLEEYTSRAAEPVTHGVEPALHGIVPAAHSAVPVTHGAGARPTSVSESRRSSASAVPLTPLSPRNRHPTDPRYAPANPNPLPPTSIEPANLYAPPQSPPSPPPPNRSTTPPRTPSRTPSSSRSARILSRISLLTTSGGTGVGGEWSTFGRHAEDEARRQHRRSRRRDADTERGGRGTETPEMGAREPPSAWFARAGRTRHTRTPSNNSSSSAHGELEPRDRSSPPPSPDTSAASESSLLTTPSAAAIFTHPSADAKPPAFPQTYPIKHPRRNRSPLRAYRSEQQFAGSNEDRRRPSARLFAQQATDAGSVAWPAQVSSEMVRMSLESHLFGRGAEALAEVSGAVETEGRTSVGTFGAGTGHVTHTDRSSSSVSLFARHDALATTTTTTMPDPAASASSSSSSPIPSTPQKPLRSSLRSRPHPPSPSFTLALASAPHTPNNNNASSAVKGKRKAEDVDITPPDQRQQHRATFAVPESPVPPPSAYPHRKRARLTSPPPPPFDASTPSRPSSSTSHRATTTQPPRSTRSTDPKRGAGHHHDDDRLSQSSIPLSALVTPHAPSLSRSSARFHMRDPRAPPRHARDTPWALRLPSHIRVADETVPDHAGSDDQLRSGGSGVGGGQHRSRNVPDDPGSPVHAWLFYVAFIVFPLWAVAAVWPVPHTRRLADDVEKAPTAVVTIDDPQIEFDARAWRFRCRIMAAVSLFTYVPFVVLVAVFASR